jgi:uncharacterized protein
VLGDVGSQGSATDTSNGDPRPKLERLLAALERLVPDGLIVAFSGGVDSAFLLWAAQQARHRVGGRVLALTTVSESLSTVDQEDAVQFADDLQVEHVVEHGSETSLPEYVRNDETRCYHCKSELFETAGRIGEHRGLRWIAYGYTVSDRGDFRPGHRAAIERGVLSPLADAKLTKADIRTLMRMHGLDLSEKAGSPCLSSRVMTGLEITPQRLHDVEAIEAILRNGGLGVFRVRVCGEAKQCFLRVEVEPEGMSKVLTLREELVREGNARGYRWVTLDLAGYRTGGGRL